MMNGLASTPTGYRLRLDFDGGEPLALRPGILHVGRLPGGALGRVEPVQALVRFIVDRRGLWLDVGDARSGVHVNGRPVRRMALLRGGDAIYLNGRELLVLGRVPDDASELPPLDAGRGDLRMVLRGTGGQYHGRAFTLDRMREVGGAGDVDIRIDDPAFPPRHARLECLSHGQVLLRMQGKGPVVLVNGHRVGDALLQAGDQVVFDAHHRFVVEAPLRDLQAVDPALVAGPDPEPARATASLRHLHWVLLAALLIAGALSLLLFGSP